MTWNFSGRITTKAAATATPHEIADAAEQHDRDQDQRIAEGEIVGRDEAEHVAVERAGGAGEEIAEREGEHLPAREIEPVAGRRDLIEADRVHAEPDPRAFEPPHQREAQRQQEQRHQQVGEIERGGDAADLDRAVEIPAEQHQRLHLDALRPAERVVDLEKDLEQDAEGDGDQRRIVPARAQHRQDQDRSDQRRHQPAEREREDRGQRRVFGDDGGGVAADAEEGRAGEVGDAGIAELDGQPERGHHQQERRRHHQDDEMLLVEPEGGDEHAGDRGDLEGPLVAADAGPHLVDEPEARAEQDRGGGDDQQRADRALAFGAEEDDAVERGDGDEGERGQRVSGRSCGHTRSLDFSAIRPVGRHVMMTMITASANTSL